MLVLLSVQSSGFNISYWKSQNLTCVHHLEDVSIPIFNGDNEVEFAAYLLENARNLKKMVIYHSGQHHSTAIKWLQNKSFCYSTAKVIFMEKSSNRSWKKAGLIFFLLSENFIKCYHFKTLVLMLMNTVWPFYQKKNLDLDISVLVRLLMYLSFKQD